MVLRGSFAKRIAMKKVMKVHEKSHARLDAFSRGMIWGMHLANVPRADIQRQVAKKDGSQPSLGAIDQVIIHKSAKPEWMGEESSAGGRPSCAAWSSLRWRPQRGPESEVEIAAHAVLACIMCRRGE